MTQWWPFNSCCHDWALMASAQAYPLQRFFHNFVRLNSFPNKARSPGGAKHCRWSKTFATGWFWDAGFHWRCCLDWTQRVQWVPPSSQATLISIYQVRQQRLCCCWVHHVCGRTHFYTYLSLRFCDSWSWDKAAAHALKSRSSNKVCAALVRCTVACSKLVEKAAGNHRRKQVEDAVARPTNSRKMQQQEILSE